mmetsp:Transcript_11035/g.21118  ORF Transcript_11035/g.21118 Transcript_11035/m.21118 type:complete len:288 (+) Transcript_11035:503-1366(+)
MNSKLDRLRPDTRMALLFGPERRLIYKIGRKIKRSMDIHMASKRPTTSPYLAVTLLSSIKKRTGTPTTDSCIQLKTAIPKYVLSLNSVLMFRALKACQPNPRKPVVHSASTVTITFSPTPPSVKEHLPYVLQSSPSTERRSHFRGSTTVQTTRRLIFDTTKMMRGRITSRSRTRCLRKPGPFSNLLMRQSFVKSADTLTVKPTESNHGLAIQAMSQPHWEATPSSILIGTIAVESIMIPRESVNRKGGCKLNTTGVFRLNHTQTAKYSDAQKMTAVEVYPKITTSSR